LKMPSMQLIHSGRSLLLKRPANCHLVMMMMVVVVSLTTPGHPPSFNPPFEFRRTTPTQLE